MNTIYCTGTHEIKCTSLTAKTTVKRRKGVKNEESSDDKVWRGDVWNGNMGGCVYIHAIAMTRCKEGWSV